jgi:hypothetical protein
MDTALVVSIGAAICAGLAAIFAGWSAWESHRSATSSESSARSAAEAVELERKRHHQESTPRLLLEHDGPVGSENDEEGIWLTNNGPLNLENFSVELTQEAKDRPIAGLVDGGQVVTLAARLGRLPSVSAALYRCVDMPRMRDLGRFTSVSPAGPWRTCGGSRRRSRSRASPASRSSS